MDCEYFTNKYKLIEIDLGKQVDLENLDLKQQIDLIERPDENNATMFFIIEKLEKTAFEFSRNVLTVV